MTDVRFAVADLVAVAKLVDPYKSQAERDWSTLGPLILGDELDSEVVYTVYEPLTFRLPGGSYTPDFLHLFECGELAFCEVKGSKKQRGYRDARAKLRAAAELNPWARFFECRPGDGGGWTVERIR